MNVLWLMAGGNDAFERAGFPYPKNLVEIAGRALIEHVVDGFASVKRLTDSRIYVIGNDEDRRFHTASVIRLLDPGARVIKAPGSTAGAACTALLACAGIDNDSPLLIVNGDIVVRSDIASALEEFSQRDLDGGVIVFDDVHPRWSYVRVDDREMIVEAAEKRPISRLATAGVYYFRRGADYVESAKSMIRKQAAIDGRFYVCPCYNEMVLAGKSLGIHRIERSDYFSLATPQGVEDFERALTGNP